MTGMADHPKPSGHRDHLWVLLALSLIVACGLLEVWASWLMIGSVAGFPKLGPMTTGWILPVTTEAYWTVALFAWLVDAPGPRSRKFAMCTAVVMFALSLGGQEAGHLLAASHQAVPWYVIAFVTALPLLAVGLGAILVHLRQLDKEDAAVAARQAADAERQAAADRAEADERAALRAQLEESAERLAAAEAVRQDAELRAADAAAHKEAAESLRAQVDTLTERLTGTEAARDEADQRAADAEAKNERLTRKLAAADKRKPGAREPRSRTPHDPAAGPRNGDAGRLRRPGRSAPHPRRGTRHQRGAASQAGRPQRTMGADLQGQPGEDRGAR